MAVVKNTRSHRLCLNVPSPFSNFLLFSSVMIGTMVVTRTLNINNRRSLNLERCRSRPKKYDHTFCASRQNGFLLGSYERGHFSLILLLRRTKKPKSLTMSPRQRQTTESLVQEKARELNEQGCFSIEVGHYDRAIVLLTEALNTVETMRFPPSRHDAGQRYASCGLDVCMEYTQNYNNLVNHGTRALNSTVAIEKASIELAQCGGGDDVSSSASGGFVYKQPFRIPYHAISEGRLLGQTLPLVIVFNLALAYHLNAISQDDAKTTTTTNNPRSREHDLENILHLYKMAYHWHMEQEREQFSSHSSGLSSLKFIMILANNLAQIHLAVQSMPKYHLCLQHLLSTMMFMVDGLQFVPHARPFSDTLFPPAELDGFLRNASCLFLHDRAAPAA